jgi:hypothetical protein
LSYTNFWYSYISSTLCILKGSDIINEPQTFRIRRVSVRVESLCRPFGDFLLSLIDSILSILETWDLFRPPTFPSVGLFRRPFLSKCLCYPFEFFSNRICRKSYFHFVLPLRRFPGFSLILVFDRLSWASLLRILGYLLPTISMMGNRVACFS